MDALFHTTAHLVHWLGRRSVAAITQIRHQVKKDCTRGKTVGECHDEYSITSMSPTRTTSIGHTPRVQQVSHPLVHSRIRAHMPIRANIQPTCAPVCPRRSLAHSHTHILIRSAARRSLERPPTMINKTTLWTMDCKHCGHARSRCTAKHASCGGAAIAQLGERQTEDLEVLVRSQVSASFHRSCAMEKTLSASSRIRQGCYESGHAARDKL